MIWFVLACLVVLATFVVAIRGSKLPTHTTSGVVSTARRQGERRADELIANMLAEHAAKRFLHDLQEAIGPPSPGATARPTG